MTTAVQIRNADYIILDKNYYPLSRASLLSTPQEQPQRVRILGGNELEVARQEMVQLVGMRDGAAALVGKVLEVRQDILLLEPIRQLKDDARMNLRIPAKFDTYLYPVEGSSNWTGRRPAVGYDLSCGGVAFFCAYKMEPGELAEIVLPMTSRQPLLVCCRVLHRRPSKAPIPLYAAEFVDMLEEQTAMVRKVVFGIQIDHRTQERRKRNL